MKRQLIGMAVVFLVTAGHRSSAQDHSGQFPAADIAAGSRVYSANCASCHGATGVGVGGIDLRRGRLPRAATDEALAKLVTTGIPGTGMPSFRFTSDEMRGLIAFVQALDARTGTLLWKSSFGSVQMLSGPITYQVDGRQYVVTIGGNVMAAYALRD